MTTRRWMIAVAIMASGLGASVGLSRRARSFERLAEAHDRDAGSFADAAWACVRFNLNRDGDADSESLRAADRYWDLFEYHEGLEEEYAGAARRPWLPVAPDPPEPPMPR
jgi:hypothetical protein